MEQIQTPDSTSPGAPLPRSKVELLFHDMLVQATQLADRNAQMLARLEEMLIAAAALPAQLRNAGSEVAANVSTDALRSLREAQRTLAHSESEIRVATKAVFVAGERSTWRVGLLCVASGFVGSVLAAGVLFLMVAG